MFGCPVQWREVFLLLLRLAAMGWWRSVVPMDITKGEKVEQIWGKLFARKFKMRATWYVLTYVEGTYVHSPQYEIPYIYVQYSKHGTPVRKTKDIDWL